ncbi:hypothetical protein SAY86_026376 [Trapa natans]|uniref:Glutamate receptor n=1 Tax=Trapa natans TaxID=22666 RepID=A0AAN7QEG2_TRANT|nr:hypothetical protein SAY86_026376 [Trapa natans]
MGQSHMTSASAAILCLMVATSRTIMAAAAATNSLQMERTVRVGVIVDSNSSAVGDMPVSSYILAALTDFYGAHPTYQTRLSLHFRNPGTDVVAAASAALDLMENEQVHAIIGPEWSSQAKFVVELGIKARVPIISFSATSPSLSPGRSRFFVRTALDDSSQVKAIAAMVQAFSWKEVVLIYEDTDYGLGLIPYLTDALQDSDTRVPYRSVISPASPDIDILMELNKVMTMPTRVFIVHMTAALGSRLFILAGEAGMLNKQTVWIVTNGLSSLLNPVPSKAVELMQGVLGVRPYVPSSKGLEDFMEKHLRSNGEDIISKINYKRNKHAPRTYEGFNLFGLWAYDTVGALAMVAEKEWAASKSTHESTDDTATQKIICSYIRISGTGAKLLNGIINLSFNGLSGSFRMANGQLQPLTFEVFNVVGNRERIIGYWTANGGLSRTMDYYEEKREYSTSKDDLEPILWPGGASKEPRGSVIPPLKDMKMRVGVPVKVGLREFFKISWDPRTGIPTYSGFSHDVFIAVLDALEFYLPYEFVPFMNSSRQSAGTYDELLYQIKLQKFDAVVGDTTIVANRSKYVDFTLPYSESGVTMLVAVKDNERRNMWVFLRPLSWDLWLTIGSFFILTGLIIWFLESRLKNEAFGSSRNEQISTSLWFSFSTLVFAHREKVVNNRTRLVLGVWIFVVLIITQSYTASLASLLTVQRLQPAYADVLDLVRNRHYVGYQKFSFVRELLVRELGFDESRMIPLRTMEEYHEALSKGSGNGGVAAVFGEIPYVRLFLRRFCNSYMMVGPTYKTDGFGFAFPQGSPLVSYFSRAILKVTENKAQMDEIERKNWLSPHTPTCWSENQPNKAGAIYSDNLSLGVCSFSGLFIITGIISLLAVLAELVKELRAKQRSSSKRSAPGSNNSRVIPLTTSENGHTAATATAASASASASATHDIIIHPLQYDGNTNSGTSTRRDFI